jgi:hypothetical protein
LKNNLHGFLFFSFQSRTQSTIWSGVAFPALQLGGKGQQRDVTCALDRFAKPSLVARARACHPARQNLASLLYERLEHFDLLVVDEVHALDAKAANFLLPEILALAATARAARAAPRTAGTAAFSTLTTPAA